MSEMLTKLPTYNIEESNIALLGSDLEKRVREHAGDKETAWESAGKVPGTEIWRIEKFTVVEWPKTRFGSFYDGDSYIVLHTYKTSSDSEELFYDLHFWIGSDTTQDEAGTAAYKTVELDDHLHGLPIQYREIQGFESPKFLSYFPRFQCLHGGISTGFHHVSATPGQDIIKLYRITAHGTSLAIREVPTQGSSLLRGDTYVLDMGSKIWQLNTQGSLGKERFKAAEFVQALTNDRQGSCGVTVYDEGGHGAGIFFKTLGVDAMPSTGVDTKDNRDTSPPSLFRLSDSSGALSFERIESPERSALSSSDAYLLDNTSDPTHPAIYIWLGKESSRVERRLAVQYGQTYLHSHRENKREHSAASIVKMNEGRESEAFLRALST